jgi:spore germination protein KC
MSFELAQLMRDEKYVGSAPVVEIWDFIDKLETSGRNAIAPLIFIHEENGQKNERVNGTAVFKRDRMVGKLNGDETKSMLFATNKIQGGVLKVDNQKGTPSYSLEILSNRTKVQPKLVNGKIEMHIETVTETGLDEVMTTEGLSGHESIESIEKRAGKELREDILSVIHKVQKEYQTDIFGFGETVHENLPKAWSRLKGQWSKEFSDIEVTVSSKVVIKSTAKTSRAIRLGD